MFHSLRKFCSVWLQGGDDRRRLLPRRANHRLQLEALEDRTTPSANLWTNADTVLPFQWSGNDNWTTLTQPPVQQAPTTPDYVLFDPSLGSGTDSVVDANYGVNRTTFDSSYGGTLLVPETMSVVNSNYFEHYGTLNVHGASINRPLGGTILTTGDYFLTGGTLNIDSVLTIDAGDFYDGGTINVLTGGVLTITSSGEVEEQVTRVINVAAGAALFIDAAHITIEGNIVIAAGGFVSLNVPQTGGSILINDSSTIIVGGALQIVAETVYIEGTIIVASAGALAPPPQAAGPVIIQADTHMNEHGTVITTPGLSVGGALGLIAANLDADNAGAGGGPAFTIPKPGLLIIAGLVKVDPTGGILANESTAEITGLVEQEGELTLDTSSLVIYGSLDVQGASETTMEDSSLVVDGAILDNATYAASMTITATSVDVSGDFDMISNIIIDNYDSHVGLAVDGIVTQDGGIVEVWDAYIGETFEETYFLNIGELQTRWLWVGLLRIAEYGSFNMYGNVWGDVLNYGGNMVVGGLGEATAYTIDGSFTQVATIIGYTGVLQTWQYLNTGDHDSLAVTGSVSLSGTFELHGPGWGGDFITSSSGQLGGAFSTVIGPELESPGHWEWGYTDFAFWMDWEPD